MQFLIGAGKSPIKCFKKDVGMMGYGMSGNTVDDLSKELSVRLFGWKTGKVAGSFTVVRKFVSSHQRSGER